MDYKQVFNELENGLFDLKLGFNETTAVNIDQNKFLNFSSIDQKTEFDGYNSLTNGNLTNYANLNQLNMNNSNGPKFNQSAKFNSDNQQFTNSNLISQSYEYAKIANEFKERLNDVFTAISFYTKAIELNPNEFRFYCNRSICLQQASRLNEALADANTAISLMPNARKPLLRKSEIYAILNKYNDAENILNFSLKLDTATDIPVEVIHEEIQKLIKTVLTKCGINKSIILQTNHCKSIEEAIDFAFSKRMEEKLSSQKFATSTTPTTNNAINNEKTYASAISLDKNRQKPNLKSLDSQETIDNLTDEELNNIGTPNRKLSANDELFTFNLQSPLRKDSFNFNQFETAKHLLNLNNNYNLIENSSSLANLNNGKFTNHIHQQSQYSTVNRHQPIDIPNMNRKRNSISLCEQSENSFSIRSLNNFDRFSNDFDTAPGFRRFLNDIPEPIYSKSLGSNLSSLNKNYIAKHENINNNNVDVIDPKYKEAVERANVCTNLIGYKGLWLGNVSSSCSRERLISIFRGYGDPIVHQLKQSPCVFVKYNNEQSPTNAIQDLHGKILPDIVHNKNEPIRLHFECNRRQQEEFFPSDKAPRNFANGECYYWRTIGCSLGKSCPKIHVPINKGIDFQVWMLSNDRLPK